MSEKKNPQVFPNSEEAEQALLGSVIIGESPDMEKAMAWIREDEAFYSSDCKSTWKCMKLLYRDGIDIDVVTLSNSIQEITGTSMAYFVTGLAEQVPTVANLENYAKIVWEKYIQRETAKSADKLYKASYSDFKEVSTILEKHTKLITELKEIQPSKKRDIEDLIEEMKRDVEEGTNLIPYHIPYLDYSAGGMTRKEITVIGGRPGHGKTTFATNIVKSLIESGYSVMMFSREMSSTEVLKKITVMESPNLLYKHIRRNEIEGDKKTEFERISDIIKDKYKNLIIYENIRTLGETVREIQKHKPDVVVDDYIQLINVEGVTEARRFEIEKIMQEYKWTCKSENCSAILISQLNREIERRIDPRPRMSDYAESGVIEQTAESAMFIFYGYNFDHERYNQYQSEVIIAKCRYGKVGTYKIGFNGNRCKYYLNTDIAQGDSLE